jgi:hypothetical protein
MTVKKGREGRVPLSGISVTFIPMLAVIAIAATIPTPACATLDSLKHSCVPKHAVGTPAGPALPYTFCDDGLPPVGGRVPNIGAVNAVAVPEKLRRFRRLACESLTRSQLRCRSKR